MNNYFLLNFIIKQIRNVNLQLKIIKRDKQHLQDSSSYQVF